MNPPRREQPRRPLSDMYHADDGVDPRTYFSEKKQKSGHVAGRLVRTVQHAAESIFAFELADPLLDGVQVVRTTAIQQGSAVEISVTAPIDTTEEDYALIKSRLSGVARIIRAEVAQTLQRRKALGITIRLLPALGEDHE